MAKERSGRAGVAVATAVVLVLSSIAGWLVFSVFVRPDRDPRWDEAAHALLGALVAHDLRAHDLTGLVLDTYRQVWWPPLHSLGLGFAFLMAGTSMETARALSVVAYVMLAPVLFLTGRLVAPRKRTLAGGVAAALALSSPALVTYAAEVMLEAPGALAIGLTMLLYAWLERSPGAPPRAHALVGVAVVLTYLVKTNYGVLVLLAIILTRLLEARFRPRPLLARRNFHLLLPIALFAVVWFAYPAKAVSTWNALVNLPTGEEVGGLAGLLYYPRAFVDLAGSWWMALLLCAGLAAAWTMRREPGVAFLAVLALTQFTLGEFHHTKAVRHVIPMFPPMFVLAGVTAARLWSRVSAYGGSVRFATAAIALGVASLHAATLARREWTPPEPRDGTAVERHVAALARLHAPVLVLGTRAAYPMPPGIDWHLVARERVFPVTAAGSAMDPRQDRELARRVAEAPLPELLRARALGVLERYDAPSGSRSLHVADRFPEESEQFARVLERTIENARPCAIIALDATPDTSGYSAAYFAPPILGSGYEESSKQEFPEAATRVHVYRDVTGSGCRPAMSRGTPHAGRLAGRGS